MCMALLPWAFVLSIAWVEITTILIEDYLTSTLYVLQITTKFGVMQHQTQGFYLTLFFHCTSSLAIIWMN